MSAKKNNNLLIPVLLLLLAVSGAAYYMATRKKKLSEIPENELIQTAGNAFNNPGNIRKTEVSWSHELQGVDSAFESFESMVYGYRAMIRLLRTYYNEYGLKTLAEMIAKYAPASENNTQSYISFVAENSPYPADQDMYNVLFTESGLPDLVNILRSMTFIEQGTDFVVNEQWITDAHETLS